VGLDQSASQDRARGSDRGRADAGRDARSSEHVVTRGFGAVTCSCGAARYTTCAHCVDEFDNYHKHLNYHPCATADDYVDLLHPDTPGAGGL